MKKAVQKGHQVNYGDATAEEVALAMRRNVAPKRKTKRVKPAEDTER